jgi:hypothetical protein
MINELFWPYSDNIVSPVQAAPATLDAHVLAVKVTPAQA